VEVTTYRVALAGQVRAVQRPPVRMPSRVSRNLKPGTALSRALAGKPDPSPAMRVRSERWTLVVAAGDHLGGKHRTRHSPTRTIYTRPITPAGIHTERSGAVGVTCDSHVQATVDSPDIATAH
jgi:hypothetical protein